MRTILFTLFVMFISLRPVVGHEFWISPLEYQVANSEAITADIRVGQKFGGSIFSFIPKNFVRFEVVQGDTVVPVEGRIGDRPALSLVPPSEGLWVVVHETTDSILTYSEWEKFANFVNHKNLVGTLENHAERGLPQTGFKESYRRFAKSLIAVGNGQGADQTVGLLTEIVAELNPYVDDTSAGIPVRVLYQGRPRAGAQVEVFEKSPNGEVTDTTLTTDATGRAIITVKPGREYLIDAVVMLAMDTRDSTKVPAWRSLWAALTFAVPE